MLNVPSQSFPAPSSQQRVSSGGRSKVPLKPGRSLMDWIRLTKSGKDLTGLKGRLIEVTEEELKKHNKKDDCWICIRGYVYNVSPYMEYHPGGEDELMRAAGSDGTDLFDQMFSNETKSPPTPPVGLVKNVMIQITALICAKMKAVYPPLSFDISANVNTMEKVHRWVNYESMLKECLVGRMAVKPTVPKDCHEEKKILNGMLPKSQVTDTLAKEGPISPSYDWFQTASLVTIVIYTKQKDLKLDSVIVDHQYESFRAETIIKDYSYLIHIELSHEIQEDFSVRVIHNVGKIEIVLKKKENTSWECLGHPLENHNSFVPKKDTGLYYRKCQLISKEDVTHDTKLFCLMLPPSTHLQVPIGQHVYLKLTITGTEIVKPYTPVSDSLLSEFKEPGFPNNRYIYFLIKIYPAGLFTPELDHLQIGDFVSVSSPEGNFKISQELEDLFLLAAGTGFTPMVKILNYALINIPSLRKVKLMFFNKTEDDIIWRSQLEKLAFKDKSFIPVTDMLEIEPEEIFNSTRFDVEFVLSAPTSEWKGKKGHISPGLLSEFLKRSLDKSRVLICICGPAPFTEQGIRMLHDLNFSKDEIHSFTA